MKCESGQGVRPYFAETVCLTPPDKLSQWIGPVADETNDPSGVYTYQTTFNLNGYNPFTAQILGQYAADDYLDEILLNGQVVATFTHTPEQYASWQTLPTISTGFVSGVNTLDFVTENAPGSVGNPTGFRVEMQGSAVSTAVPFTIYNTGVDDFGAPLPAGAADPHYQITAAPTPYAPGNAPASGADLGPCQTFRPHAQQACGDARKKPRPHPPR